MLEHDDDHECFAYEDMTDEEERFAKQTPEFRKFMREGGGDQAKAAMEAQVEDLLAQPIISDESVSPRFRFAKHPTSAAEEAKLKFKSDVVDPVLYGKGLMKREQTKRVEYGPHYTGMRREEIMEEEEGSFLEEYQGFFDRQKTPETPEIPESVDTFEEFNFLKGAGV